MEEDTYDRIVPIFFQLNMIYSKMLHILTNFPLIILLPILLGRTRTPCSYLSAWAAECFERIFFSTLKSNTLAQPKFSIALVNPLCCFEWVNLVTFRTSASRKIPRIITEKTFDPYLGQIGFLLLFRLCFLVFMVIFPTSTRKYDGEGVSLVLQPWKHLCIFKNSYEEMLWSDKFWTLTVLRGDTNLVLNLWPKFLHFLQNFLWVQV